MLLKLLQYVFVFVAKLFLACLMLMYALVAGLLWKPSMFKEAAQEVVPTLEWLFHPTNWDSL